MTPAEKLEVTGLLAEILGVRPGESLADASLRVIRTNGVRKDIRMAAHGVLDVEGAHVDFVWAGLARALRMSVSCRQHIRPTDGGG